MRNPLIKRLPRELKHEAGKYIVLFLFITIVIGFVSGFLVASGSMRLAYDESFDKYNVEDGNFELYFEAEDSLIEILEKEDVTIYENYYIERETDDIDSTLRIFKVREEVNKACVMEGTLPTNEKEIAIDRMYADNNQIAVGDTITIDGDTFTVSGLVALSDYSALFSSQSDMMFDAKKFGVAVMTEQGFDSMGESGFHFSYVWQYDKDPVDEIEEKEMSEDFLEVLTANAVVTNFVPRYTNQAIQFTGNDLGRDSSVVTMFLYIVVAIIAFIFAITTSNTIAKEATVIGTLRASGFSKGELVRHYMTMPVLVTFISALIGNVLGYTVFKDVAAAMYYASYSLPTYITIWNAKAFVLTTVGPVILMVLINFMILVNKLSLSPLKFIRKDLTRKQKKKAFRLNTRIGIMKRFRLRIIFQNMPNYITIVVGIFFANIILLLGLAMPALMEKFGEDITSNMICENQYILKMPVETETEGAEKYCAGSLKTIEGRLRSEDVTVFGIVPDSQYIDLELDAESIYISNAFSEKHRVKVGDTVTLKESYGEKEYTFTVKGIYYYPAGIAVFMSQEYFNETFEYDENYFNGYFSKEEIDDIDDMMIATRITEDDLTKTSRQMMLSMGEMMDMMAGFGIVMFMLIIYLLSKIIIEKNAQSISMTKILGYTDNEISGLYVMATSLVTIASFVLTIPVVDVIMKYVCEIMLSEFSGWLPYYVPFSTYIKMVVAGVLSYAVIAFIQFRRVKNVPLDVALKNVE